MVFSSLKFIFVFIPLFYSLYILFRKRAGNVLTLLASLAFYVYGTWNQPEYIILIIMSVLANYFFGRLIEFKKHKKVYLIAGLVYHFFWLALYKYSAFFISNLHEVFGTELPFQQYMLPLGISFYTFQEVS